MRTALIIGYAAVAVIEAAIGVVYFRDPEETPRTRRWAVPLGVGAGLAWPLSIIGIAVWSAWNAFTRPPVERDTPKP